MAVITPEMVNTLNGRLAQKGSEYRVVIQEYEEVAYGAELRIPERKSLLRPYLVEEIEFTNCSSSEQQMTSTVSKEIAETSEWFITAGMKIGLSVEVEAGAFFAKAKTTLSTEFSVEGGTRQSETATVTIAKEIGLRVPPQTTTSLHVLLEQEEARAIPFIINLVLLHAPFKYCQLVPVYRFYNKSQSYHCYTTDWTEAQAWRQDPALRDESVTHFLGYVFPAQQPGTVPVFRFATKVPGDYVCTSDVKETQFLRGRSDFVEQTPLGYVYAEAQPGTVQVSRFFGKPVLDHVYTTDPVELEYIRKLKLTDETTVYRFGYLYRTLPEAEITDQDITMLLDEAGRSFEVKGVFSGASISSKVAVTTEEKPVGAVSPAAPPVLAAPPAGEVVRLLRTK